MHHKETDDDINGDPRRSCKRETCFFAMNDIAQVLGCLSEYPEFLLNAA